ncbi:MAG: MFS transporter [Myxococcota bacterium]|nr:MFS transporter [Myxococcota bacterium]
MSAPLRSGRIVLYALPSLLSSVAALPLALFVPAFYADDLGVPLAAVGVAIAASRLLDLVTDPLIGTLSDRLRLPGGRRRPWIVLGTPLFVVSLWQVFVPGESASQTYLLVWSALLYLGFTMIDLPHKAWGAELSPDYDERSRITGIREGLSAAGQVALLAVLVWLGARGVSDASDQLRGMAIAVVVLLPLLVGGAVFGVGEGRPEGYAHAPRTFVSGLRLVAENPAFRRMIGAVIFFVGGVAIQGTLHRLVLADVMGDESRFPLMLLIENLATLAAVPVWLRISQSTGKHRALAAAALWIAVLSLPLVFLRSGDLTTLIALVAIRGSSFASILFLSNSIAADVIDVDTLASGEQRSGLYFAVWGMVTKLALALGVLLGTTLPAWLGYDPSQEVIPAEIQARLMFVYGAIPALLMSIGAGFLVGFPITRERHAAVRAELRSREGGAVTPG